LSGKRRPRDAAKRPKPEWRKVVENFSRISKRESVPRNPAQARAWLKQFASELHDTQSELRGSQTDLLKALRRVPKTARNAIGLWIKPYLALSPHLANWFINAVDAYTLEEPSEGKRRARSMDVALGLTPRSGRPRDTQGNRPKIAIDIYSLREEGKSWNEIADRLQIEDARTARRIYAAHPDAVVKHLISRGPSVPLGYDLKDGKLVVNKAEAATVRMIFERYVPLGSAPAPKRAFTALVRKLKAEGIIDKRGKPIDIYKVINNRVYIGEAVGKGIHSGKHEAIVDRALWLKVHRVRRVIMPTGRRRRRKKDQ
jgi:hypothetical protein